MTHICRSSLLHKQVTVLVVGAGGTGSLLASDLARLQIALEERGHPGGMAVTVVDGDSVSEANVGRQTFYTCDIGHNKAEVVANRINACYGLNWTAIPAFMPESGCGKFDVVISCVDSAKARRTIQRSFARACPYYWLDMGNKAHVGQCVLGEPLARGEKEWRMRLPTVTDLYPQILDEKVPEDDTPSCSLAEALEKQGLFINRAMALFGLQMLEQLIINTTLEYHAVFVDLKRAKTTNLPVSKDLWAQMGHCPNARRDRPNN